MPELVPANKFLFAGMVPANKFLFAGRVPANNLFLKFLKRETLDLLYKITVRSVIDYSLPVYSNNLKLSELARLDRLQYKAGKLVTGALHYTNREKLNEELGWENFQTRIKFLGLTLFQKIHLHQTWPLVRKSMTKNGNEELSVAVELKPRFQKSIPESTVTNN